jgi:Tol biopolymer transport system component
MRSHLKEFGSRVLPVMLVAGGALFAVPGVASAAFPGPNGSIVFQSTESGITPCSPFTSSELFSVPPSGGAVSQVDCNGHTDQHAFVSPDGTEVVFASNRSGGSGAFQLFTESLTSPGGAVSVSYPPNAGVDDFPSWAPAAPGAQATIIFQRTLPGGIPQLYTENVNTPSSPATPVFSTPSGFSDTEPVFDPSNENENEIAFVRQASGGPEQIYTYDLSTPATPPVNLSSSDGDSATNDSKPDFAPTKTGSPAAQEIVFQSDRPTTTASGGPCAGTQLYTMTDRPGSAVTPVFQVTSGSPPAPTGQQTCPSVSGTNVATENPVFSPQGNAIAYDQPGPNSQDVFTYDVSLSNGVGMMNTVKDLTPNFATDESPNWAPVFPGASTPEVSQSIVLPAAGVGVFGVAGLLALRKRRRTQSLASKGGRPAALVS